jgi:amino acid adenylation domain-containing protein
MKASILPSSLKNAASSAHRPEWWVLAIPRWEALVAAQPEASAVTFDGESLSYGELNARANRLADCLRERGVGPGEIVGIHLDRSFSLIVAILAVLKAGGAYLPLDLACPDDRLNFMLEDSGARVLLTEAGLASRFQPHVGQIVCLDLEVNRLAKFPAENRSVVSQPDAPAYIIYTSGSTGLPKGVSITHLNLARLFTATEGLFDFGPRDVWTLFHSSAFDFSVWEIFGALLHGGRLVIVSYMVSRSAAAFRELLARERVTVLNQTPSAFRQLVRADETAPKLPPALRYVIFGGEAMEPQILRPWFDRYGDREPQCVNMYGITETTVHVTHYPVTRADLDRPGSPIGRALPDLKIYLTNEQGARVKPGETGEMLVGGDGVAPGYLNRPDLTRERFIANPFEPGAFPVLYRSGDLARERPDGTLEYLGRTDHQVKIRGFRIELSEIESALIRQAGVRECAVLSRQDEDAEPRLVAYVVARGEKAPSVEDLRSHLGHVLPEYMIPTLFVFLPELPLTLNGKLDRAALPAPGAERPELASAFIEPTGELEEKLARMWKAILRRETVGRDDNFFDLGGDSLLLTTLHLQLQGELQRTIPVTDLFQFSTIRSLAAYLHGTSANKADETAARAQRQRAAFARSPRPAPTP